MIVRLDYASPSVLTADQDSQRLGLCGDARRPVRFSATVVRHAFLLRVALRALGTVIWSDDTWAADGGRLDPVITVHPDRVFLEAFSQDQSTWAQVILDPSLFRTEGPVQCGTTNVDFTAWLHGALAEMRSSRTTTFTVSAAGFAVATAGGGGRFEQKVDLPDGWVRGFLQVQAAMAMPATRLAVRPVDLLAAIRWLRYTKARLSPRALRYEFEPGQDARLVLEPWEHVVPLRGAEHACAEPRTVRLWGRRRLALLEPLLPFADGVDVRLAGRALPSFYAVRLPGITFVLGVTGHSAQAWTGAGSFDLLQEERQVPDALQQAARALLRERYAASADDVAARTGCDPAVAAAALQRECRLGRAVFDLQERRFRHRELFDEPIDEARFYPPDERVEAARAHLRAGEVEVTSCAVRETRKQKLLKSPLGRELRDLVFRDWVVAGTVGAPGAALAVEIVLGERGAVVFGRCGCPFFAEHLLARGPCAHMLALLHASSPQRRDAATSQPTEVVRSAPARTDAEDVDGAPEDDDVASGDEDGDHVDD